MERPDSPRVEPSEPEVEQRLIDSVVALKKSGGTLNVIPIGQARDVLVAGGLDVDSDGFVVDCESGERVEPFAFDSGLFREVESPVDDPFSAYYRVESECERVIGAKGEIHLSDVHTVCEFDGVVRPVRDDSINLQRAGGHLGVGFPMVFEWSDSLEFAKDVEAVSFRYPEEGELDVELGCFECGFDGSWDEWDVDYSEWLDGGVEDTDSDMKERVLSGVDLERGELRCPECSCLWDVFSLDVCTSCQTMHRWEDITPDDDEEGGGMYWEPSCPDCRAGCGMLESEDRYSPFENGDVELLE